MNANVKSGKRRGLSQLLAVIITIGIVIALGAFLFAWSPRPFFI